MNNLLDDPKVVISIITIINAISIALVFQWWRNRKSLSYKVIFAMPLLSIRQEVNHRVQILLDGIPVKNVHSIIVSLANNGYLMIEDKDFVTPLMITFDQNTEIITAEVTESVPVDLPVRIQPDKNSITIEPIMLNRGDSFTIRILVREFHTVPKVTGRIKGIPKLKGANTKGNWGRLLFEMIKSTPGLFMLAYITILGTIGLISLKQLGFIILAFVPPILLIVFLHYILWSEQDEDREGYKRF